MVWFRVGCCERCGGVGSRGERGESGTEAHTVLDSIPSIASIIPKMRMRGSGGTIPLGGGGTWPRDWYIYIYIYILYIYMYITCTPSQLAQARRCEEEERLCLDTLYESRGLAGRNEAPLETKTFASSVLDCYWATDLNFLGKTCVFN